MEYELTDKKIWPSLTGLMCGAALLSLAGCGGGGSGVAGSTNATASPDGAVAATGAPPAATSQLGPTAQSPTASTSAVVAASAPSGPSPVFGDCEMFPANAIFNTRIDDTSRFPVHSRSVAWVNLAGRDVPFSTNWGNSENPADRTAYFGEPINVVDGTPATTTWPVVSFDFSTSGQSTDRGYPDKSDCAVDDGHGGFAIGRNCASLAEAQRRFPFPVGSQTLNEGGTCNDPRSCGDHHVLVVEKGVCRLW